mmetsp:Transcript_19848/g.35415  ORF Transcript_19848/g.35415 Transcript_19848/m.35415 type:complete len:212 (-) Transcript_19848:136-771(-)
MDLQLARDNNRSPCGEQGLTEAKLVVLRPNQQRQAVSIFSTLVRSDPDSSGQADLCSPVVQNSGRRPTRQSCSSPRGRCQEAPAEQPDLGLHAGGSFRRQTLAEHMMPAHEAGSCHSHGHPLCHELRDGARLLRLGRVAQPLTKDRSHGQLLKTQRRQGGCHAGGLQQVALTLLTENCFAPHDEAFHREAVDGRRLGLADAQADGSCLHND